MKRRIEQLTADFERFFEQKPRHFIQSTGRMELLGNHTDHQGGVVLVAGIDLTMIAAIGPRDDNKIVLNSDGYPRIEVDLDDLAARASDYNRTSGIIRGVAYRMKELGYQVAGMSLTLHSLIKPGSGVSSSAAVELLLIKALSILYNEDKLDRVTMAHIAKHAENVHFGKPSGLLDQMGIALGGINFIDFEHESEPHYDPIPFPFDDLHFLIINTGGSHTDLTEHYALVKQEMLQIAAHFHKNRLADVSYHELQRDIVKIVDEFGVRPVNRALHFFQECERVREAKFALMRKDQNDFLRLVNDSGISSEQLLENITYPGDKEHRLYDGLAYCREIINSGALRVHGGGFAGTILAIIPDDEYERFKHQVEQRFDANHVSEVHIIENGLCAIDLQHQDDGGV